MVVGWDSGTRAGCPTRPASLPDHHGVLRGDVDGDGLGDRVSVKVASRAPRQCRFLLFTRTARGDLVRRLPVHDDFRQRWPQVVVLVGIDEQQGAEVLVTLEHGASQAFAGLFTVRAGALRRFIRHGRDALLNFYGSLGYGAALDCIDRGGSRLIHSGYGNIGDGRHIIEREFLRIERLTLRVVRRERYWRPSKELPWLAFPEFRGQQPFPSCAIARNSQAG